MTRTLLASALALCAALPAFAMEDMPCKDFVAMDEAGQMHALSGDGMMAESGNMMAGNMASGSMTSEGSMAGDSMMKGGDAAAAAKACGMHPDMTVGAAMQAAH